MNLGYTSQILNSFVKSLKNKLKNILKSTAIWHFTKKQSTMRYFGRFKKLKKILDLYDFKFDCF
ncbi:hypothetical protein CHL10075_07570 [Campylobacter hyointestinalis subsp. lawsonii]|nr:hypothetical protein CHL10075_07570 [Campylobacter hyointestinalis subsp. lawsonii]